MKASDRIAVICEHIERAHYLRGSAALACATEIYLDEQKGYGVPANHPLRLAEKAAGIDPLEEPAP